ncbi:hypothetical protein ANT_23600 [Anaerolinea thermophila UNI-1]|uniref:Uncharacterized protein n=1 Tax=Anaerolinea thermophila (strain DSM 14523 / JCM 11388 / NBRC 100420 / UNI-1) TaxID=926569 RepID=E8MYQ0_ANATU|nr:hypothetical protein ANT_23600 [Anaerolinea thermophila UNI-1]
MLEKIQPLCADNGMRRSSYSRSGSCEDNLPPELLATAGVESVSLPAASHLPRLSEKWA